MVSRGYFIELICYLLFDVWCLTTHNGVTILANLRPAINPRHAIHIHLTTCVRTLHIVGVVENPILSLIVGDNLRVVTCALHVVIAREENLVVVIQHRTSLLIHIRTIERLTTAYNGLVGTLQTLTAATRRGEKVVVITTLVDICSLVCRACDAGEVVNIIYLKTILC